MQVPKVYDAVRSGATIGSPNVGGSWNALQALVHSTLQTTAEALFNLDLGTQAVTTAAEVIARDYGDADAFSQARVKDVQKILVAPRPRTTPIRMVR